MIDLKGLGADAVATLRGALDRLADPRRPRAEVVAELAAARAAHATAGEAEAACRKRAEGELVRLNEAVVAATLKRDDAAREWSARLREASSTERNYAAQVARLEREAATAAEPALDALDAELRQRTADLEAVEPAAPAVAALLVAERRAVRTAMAEVVALRGVAPADLEAEVEAIRGRLAAASRGAREVYEAEVARAIESERLKLFVPVEGAWW